MIALGVSALPFDDTAGFTAPPAFGPFRVLHQIGSGVLGPVFRTFDPRHDKLVAVKAFRLDVVPEVSARLADQLRHLAATPIDHPAVVAAIDAGLEGTTAYLAMEYVAAETLDVSLGRLAPAPAETVVPLLRQVAEGIEAAWAQGVGHGSLHPRDIFVPSTLNEPDVPGAGVRVAGFGVAAALETLNIAVPVRRPYAAPERELGSPWDVRADVYSLGVIAYELLTGERPGGPPEEVAEMPTASQPGLDPGIRRALGWALSANPAGRFATPTAFVDALKSGATPRLARELVAVPLTLEAEPEMELEPELEPEPESVRALEPEPEIERELVAAEARVDRVRMWSPETARDSGSADSHDAWRVTPEPKENAMPRYLALLALGLVAGTAFGYWLRGTSADAPVDMNPVATEVTKVPEEPIGTDVAVTPAATPSPTPAPATVPETAPATEPAPGQGRLLVRSVPSGATVTVNGQDLGTTPATIRDLPFGSHTIAVSRTGYQSRDQTIAVSATVPAREITVELTPVRAAAPPVAGATTGTINVESRPAGATVSINGRVVGNTPLRVPELSPASYTVRVELAGHKPVTTTVVVRAGEQTPLRVSLEVQK